MVRKHRLTITVDKLVWKRFVSFCALNDKVPSHELEKFMKGCLK